MPRANRAATGEAVALAIADEGPPVIGAFPDHLHLVTPARAVFMQPQLPGRRVNVQTHRIAMAITPDLGARRGLAGFLDTDEGVVFGHTAVIVQTQNAAGVVGAVLGLVAALAVTDRKEKITFE